MESPATAADGASSVVIATSARAARAGTITCDPDGSDCNASGSISSPSVTTTSVRPAASALSTTGCAREAASPGTEGIVPARTVSPNRKIESALTSRASRTAARHAVVSPPRRQLDDASSATKARAREAGAAGASSASATASATMTKRAATETRAAHPVRSARGQ